jgi:hypothetical protein
MIIDFHCHLGDWGVWADSPSMRVRKYEKYGVDKGVVMGGVYLDDWRDKRGSLRVSDFKFTNEATLKAIRDYPERFIGFAWINPQQSDILRDLAKYLGEWGFKGIGELIPYGWDFPNYSEPMVKVCEVAEKYKIPISAHTGPERWGNAAQFAALASEFPNVKFILAHMGWFDLEAIRQSVLTASRHENIYLETSSMPYPRMIRYAAETIGHDRILFGSDTGSTGGNDLEYEMEKIKGARLPQRAIECIMGGNASELLGL